MGDAIRFSVCITTYQHAPYIERCIRSVLDQQVDGELEVLVGDDGSTDGTRRLVDAVAAADVRVRPFHHVQNLGPTGNLAFLVAEARGEFIAHLDGDDQWLPGKLAAQSAVLQGDAGVVAVYCNARVVDAEDRSLGVFNRGAPRRIDMPALLRRGNFLNHSSLLYRAFARDAVLGVGVPFIDFRLHLRLLRYGPLAYVDEVLVVHRWRTRGSMIRTMPEAVYEGHLDAFREALAGGASHDALAAAISHFWGKLVVQALLARRPGTIVAWGRRLLAERGFGLSLSRLVVDAGLAIPRAIRSWWARRPPEAVFFP